MGTVAVGVGKGIAWLWGKTLGQRIDGYAARVEFYAEEARADRAERRAWELRHEEWMHGYPPRYGSNGHGPSPHPTPTPTLGNAVRSHRR
jgi:hypothetical protein